MPNQKIAYMSILILLNIMIAVLIMRSPSFQSMFDDNNIERKKLMERFC